jgi:hypothetical protein
VFYAPASAVFFSKKSVTLEVSSRYCTAKKLKHPGVEEGMCGRVSPSRDMITQRFLAAGCKEEAIDDDSQPMMQWCGLRFVKHCSSYQVVYTILLSDKLQHSSSKSVMQINAKS